MHASLSQHTLTNEAGLPLRVDLHLPGSGAPSAALMVCHGFKGFKDWGFFPFASGRLAAAGFAVANFNFSMNGVGARPGEFDRLDLFEANTYSRELSDLQTVAEWLRVGSPVASIVGARGMGILGHSRGALASLALAAVEPRIAAVVTWNGVAYAVRTTKRQLAEWERDGRMEFVNSRTGQRMAVGWGLVEDARAHGDRLEPAACAARMTGDLLVIHGSKDLAVAPEEAEVLRAGRNDPEHCRLEIIEGASHTFGAVHPFAGTTEHLDKALELTCSWFQERIP